MDSVIKILLGENGGIAMITSVEDYFVYYELDYVPEDFYGDLDAFVTNHQTEGYSMAGTLNECLTELNKTIKEVMK